jgi:hypothetical protein
MNDQETRERDFGARDEKIRAALDQHWAESNANDFETEDLIYRKGVVVDYPQSGEKTRGKEHTRPTRQSAERKAVYGSANHWRR